MVKKALIADEKNNYSIAQRFYLQAIEYLIPAIQCIFAFSLKLKKINN
jgi:hypothetical protein